MIRTAAVGVLLGLLVLLGAGPALAHDRIVGSEPADGAQLATGPTKVTLTLNGPVQVGFDTLTVVGPDGNLWSTGDTTVQGSQVSIAVRPLGPAGTYTIGYRVSSGDGHPVTGSQIFTLTTAGTGTPGPPAAATRSNPNALTANLAGGGVPVWPLLAGAVLVFAGGSYLAVRRGKNAPPRTRPMD